MPPMKLYTKRGDDGSTDLFGGRRVSKTDPRVQAYGSVDELNCLIGLARAACPHAELSEALSQLQARLFDLGADLATPHDGPARDKVDRIKEGDIQTLERMIDETTDRLPVMQYFILPGGSEVAARLHVARAVARRAERHCVWLLETAPEHRLNVIYLNRLSDLLFVLARWANQLDGLEDVPWKPRR